MLPTEISMNFQQHSAAEGIELWPIDKLVFYARNPRKNDAAVDRMCSSIREFGFKIPKGARSDGEVVDGHLRLKAARKLGIAEVRLRRPSPFHRLSQLTAEFACFSSAPERSMS